MSNLSFPEMFEGQPKIELADGRLCFLPCQQGLIIDGLEVEIRPKEARLLSALSFPPDTYRSVGALNRAVFDDTLSDAVAVTISRLRQQMGPEIGSSKKGVLRKMVVGNLPGYIALSSLLGTEKSISDARELYSRYA